MNDKVLENLVIDAGIDSAHKGGFTYKGHEVSPLLF
jgi:hypothetical protein